MPLRFRQEVQALPRQAGEGLKRALGLAVLLTLGAAMSASAAESVAHHPLADRACAALTERVNAVPGKGPVFLRSYDAASGQGAGTEPALNAAFTYDNALAVIALVACDETSSAQRVGDAL